MPTARPTERRHSPLFSRWALGRQAVGRLIEARRTVAFRGGRPRADCVFLGMPTARPQGTRALPAFLAETTARGAICGGRHADPPAASVRLADHAATGGFVRGYPTGHCILACRSLGREPAPPSCVGSFPADSCRHAQHHTQACRPLGLGQQGPPLFNRGGADLPSRLR